MIYVGKSDNKIPRVWEEMQILYFWNSEHGQTRKAGYSGLGSSGNIMKSPWMQTLPGKVFRLKYSSCSPDATLPICHNSGWVKWNNYIVIQYARA